MDSSSILILVVLIVLITIIIWNNKAEPYMRTEAQNYVFSDFVGRYQLESGFNQVSSPHKHKFKFKLHPNK